jgi:hypothetical protein
MISGAMVSDGVDSFDSRGLNKTARAKRRSRFVSLVDD